MTKPIDATPQAKESSTILYGIPNCDTVRKSRAWLREHDVPVHFHDFKKLGVPRDRLVQWVRSVGWQALLNRRGTTWRKQSTEIQAAVVDDASATDFLMLEPSAIKRPVIEWSPTAITVGFEPEQWQRQMRR